MHKELPKATVEQIEDQIRNFIGVGGGGIWTFQLSCKVCRDLGIISTTSNGIKPARERVKAAIKFTEQGWRVDGYELVCPKCYKEKYLRKS